MKHQRFITCLDLLLGLLFLVSMIFSSPVYSQFLNNDPVSFPSQEATDQVVFATHFCPNFDSSQKYPNNATTQQRDLYVDKEGNSYLAGTQNQHGIKGKIAFLAKFSPDGSLLFSTFLGSTEFFTDPAGIAMDRLGRIWLAGHTNDPGFPLIHSWDQAIKSSESSLFFTSFSSEGECLFSTLWGGSKVDEMVKFSLDAKDNLCIVGRTRSSDLPLKNSIFEFSVTENSYSYFISSIDPKGQLHFSTYWLDTQSTRICDLIHDDEQNLIIGGSTSCLDYPLKDALQDKLRNQQDAFITKISPEGKILFSTLVGGSEKDEIVSLFFDYDNNLTALGNTKSQDFPLKKSYWGPTFSTDFEKTFLLTLSKNHHIEISDILGPFNATQVKRDLQGNYYLLSSGGGMEDYHYANAFVNINLSPAPLSGRNSRIYVFMPNLHAYASCFIFADALSDIYVHPLMSDMWFSGASVFPMPCKNAYQEFARDSAVLGKIKLPPSLAKPYKLLLQIGQEKATFMEKGEVTELPPLEAPPMIMQGRTLIPVRVLAETLGMNVSWVSVGQYVWLDREGVRLELQIGRNFAWKYALNTPEKRVKLAMDVPPMIVNNRTLLPLRFVTENFGALVDWNGFEQRILVSWE